MNELDINRHSFDLAKNRLKEFSEKTEAELAIDRVRTDGGFLGLGDHKVTGYELNNRLESIQGNFIDFNSIINKMIKEIGEVYNVFDTLDKDCLASIVAIVKAIEKTSNDIRKQQNKLDSHQVEINKNVDNMKKIVAMLKASKEKLDGYKHLKDIDKIWSDCKTIRNDIQVVSNSITALSKKTTNDIATINSKNKDLLEKVNKEILALQKEAKTYVEFFSDLYEKIDSTANRLDEQIPIIEKNSDFVSQVNSIAHLNDVDSIWEDVTNAKESISNIENELQTAYDIIHRMQKHFDQLDEFIAAIDSYTHMKDIDSMWEELSTLKKEVADLIKAVDDNNKVIQEHRSDLERLNSVNEKHQDELDKLSQNQNETKEYAEANRSSIAELQAFRSEVDSIEHIADVGSMWEQGNDLKTDLADANNHIVSLQEKTTEIDKVIADKTAEMQDKVVLLETKLKYAYYIAGGALGLAVIELMLTLIGVI